jgi:hypothetical protein
MVSAAIIGAVTLIWNVGRSAVQTIEEKVAWRDASYERLRELRVGMTIKRVDDLLGSPAGTARSARGDFEQRVYAGRDHWVQVFSTRDRTVHAFVVASCDVDFRPAFESTSGFHASPDPEDPKKEVMSPIASVTLNRTPLGKSNPSHSDYKVWASRPPTFVEWLPASNATSLLSYGWGVVAACPSFSSEGRSQIPPGFPFDFRTEYGQVTSPTSRAAIDVVNRWRQTALVNAWSVCLESCDPQDEPFASFEWGVRPDEAQRLDLG